VLDRDYADVKASVCWAHTDGKGIITARSRESVPRAQISGPMKPLRDCSRSIPLDELVSVDAEQQNLALL